MSSLSISVGLDYHDQKVQVCVLDCQGRLLANRGVDNDAQRIHDFASDPVFTSSEAYQFVSGDKAKLDSALTPSYFSSLPTSDPQVNGQLWNDNGTLKVSADPPPPELANIISVTGTNGSPACELFHPQWHKVAWD